MITDWRNKRVTVMGLGRFGGGVGAARWLAQAGARVTVTDQQPAEKLSGSLQQLAGLAIKLHLGGHAERDFREADLVVVNPAVPPHSPFIRAALDGGVPVTTEINLFVERCPAACVGVTGSVGKSTTAAMIAHVLERTMPGRPVWFGGNIGCSLLEELERIGPQDLVVLELSSFQLERTPLVGWSPHVAVITNLAPNHLDWHGSFDGYVEAKLNIARFQDAQRDHAVLGDDGMLQRAWRVAFGAQRGAWTYRADGELLVGSGPRQPGASDEGCDLAWSRLRLAVPGRHNRENAAAALTVAHLLGADADLAARAITTFEGLPHRLQRVCIRDGVTYYNDSKSTTPAATVTALSAIDGPLLLIMGGYDKQLDLTAAIELAARRARFTACIGQTGPRLVEGIRAAGGCAELCSSLEEAVRACQRQARRGESVLLSPACASWDMFEDYRQRGEEFVRLVTG